MKIVFTGIGKLFRFIWRSLNFTRQLIFNIIFFLFIAGIFIGMSYTEQEPQLPESAALVLDLSGPIVEQRSYDNPIDRLASDALGQPPVEENVLYEVVKTIRIAATDERVSGLVLNLRHMSETNLTKLRYIAKAIEEFKASEKPVIAVGDNYRQSQYYLSSYADKVLMSPDGGVLLTGYGSYSLYYKSLLEKLDVSTHVFRVGTYKSFVEPYTRDGMSDEAREAKSAWLDQLWQAFTQDVAANREIKAESLTPELDSLVEQLKATQGDFAKLALNMGLVDELATRPQQRAQLVEQFGSDDNDSFNKISFYDYSLAVLQPEFSSDNDIAVVVASGAIVDGPERQGVIGGDTTAALLREARLDDNIKAVVLRVDSPGGSAFASEVIRNEVDELKAAGKPVVVSMSSVAASGGYWIASSADKIVAQPTTITGSIGIFAILTTFEKGLEKMGVYNDGIGTTPFSGVGITRELPPKVAEVIQLGVDNGYQRFINLVSTHRSLPLEQTDAIAQGRVWTGKDALERGLVDELGDLDVAIESAAELAQLEDYQLNWMRQPLSPMQLLLQELTSEARAVLAATISDVLPQSLQSVGQQISTDLMAIQNFNDPKGQYAFCLNCQVQ